MSIRIMRNKTLCFSGHRTENLPQNKDGLNFMVKCKTKLDFVNLS